MHYIEKLNVIKNSRNKNNTIRFSKLYKVNIKQALSLLVLVFILLKKGGVI